MMPLGIPGSVELIFRLPFVNSLPVAEKKEWVAQEFSQKMLFLLNPNSFPS